MSAIVWLKSKEEAFSLAKAQGKKVLLLVGSKLCDATLFMRDTVCELPSAAWPDEPDIKGLIERNYIPWYGGASYSVPGAVGDPMTTDWYDYAPRVSFSMPMIAVIDPNTDKCLGENSYGSTPRVVGNTSKFDSPKFYARLLQYTTEKDIPVVCAYTLSPASSIFKPSATHTAMGDIGNKGTVKITALPKSCSWTAVSNDSWIKITAGSAGTGNGEVSYSVSENTGSPRTGTMTIAGQTFTITQSGVTSTVIPPVVPPVVPPVAKTTLYYPHIATIDGWQTELCLLNTSNKLSIGSLKLYNENGVLTGEKTLTLPAFGRKQILVNADFPGAGVDYAVFSTESASAQGYARFWKPGEYGSALEAITEGKTFGVLAKIEREGGWTGIVFVNMGLAPAAITLTAYTDAGIAVATKALSVGGNGKVVNTIEKLFTQDISKATYVTFLSDQKVAGFELMGSADGKMLDGFNSL